MNTNQRQHHHMPARKRRAHDEAATPSAARMAEPAQSLATLRQPQLDGAERARAVLGMQRVIGNAAVRRELARCACTDKRGEEQAIGREISTPLPKDAEFRKDGAALLVVADVQVVVKPDRVSKNKKLKGARTSFRMSRRAPKPIFKKGELVELVPPKITVTIQTTYGPKADPDADSAYGKGTTEADKQSGHTSLQFHEGSHGLDYITFIRENPPSLHATVGMSSAEYKQALKEFNQLMKSYAKNMDAFSTQRTDCVGTTIDQAGFTKKPMCE